MMGRFVIDGSFCIRRELAAEGNRDVDVQRCFGRAIEFYTIAFVVGATGEGIAGGFEPRVEDVAECLADGDHGTGEDSVFLGGDDFFDQACRYCRSGSHFEATPVVKLHGDGVHVLLDAIADVWPNGRDGIEVGLECIPQRGDFGCHGRCMQVHANDAKCGKGDE